jgi:nitrite reductase/ring-hydroxylating ferredoxin subunit
MPNISFELYLHIPTQLADLSVSGSKTWPQGGFNGLIIHRSGQSEYKAFERTCTHQPLDKCILEIEDILFAVCPCCSSRFQIPSDGAVLQGPAKWPLKQYRTSIVGVNLRIYN